MEALACLRKYSRGGGAYWRVDAYWNKVSSLMFRIIVFLKGKAVYMNANNSYNSDDAKQNTNCYTSFMLL